MLYFREMPPAVKKWVRSPRWFWIVPRVLVVTFILTAFLFAVSLFLGILGIVISSRLRGIAPNMTLAYRHVALPTAAVAAGIVLVSATAVEVRHYRQAKALAAIGQVGGKASV